MFRCGVCGTHDPDEHAGWCAEASPTVLRMIAEYDETANRLYTRWMETREEVARLNDRITEAVARAKSLSDNDESDKWEAGKNWGAMFVAIALVPHPDWHHDTDDGPGVDMSILCRTCGGRGHVSCGVEAE